MTLDQAKALRAGQIVHYIGRVACTRTVGPRGGVTVRTVDAKVNGQVKTWKRDAGRVSVPVKRGLWEYAYITERDLADWHLAGDCPLIA